MRNGIPNLGALQAFEATARLGSFSRAAEALSLTHSAIHRQVAGLEARLGVQLFTRVRRRIVLTEHGAEYAGRIRHHLEQIEKDTFGLVHRSGMGRHLHIAVLPTLAASWLIPRLPGFQRLRPDITVSLSLRTLPFQFKDQPFDAAIYHGEHLWPGTHGTLLFLERELVPVCAPALFASMGSAADVSITDAPITDNPVTDNPIAHMTHLHLNSRPDAWRQWYVSQDYPYGPQAAAGPRYDVFTMVLAAAKAGLGVGLVPRFITDEALDAGELIIPRQAALPVSEGYYFGYPERSERAPALVALESWLKSVV